MRAKGETVARGGLALINGIPKPSGATKKPLELVNSFRSALLSKRQ